MKKAIFFRSIGPNEKIISCTRRLAEGMVNSGWLVAWIWGPLPLSILYKLRAGYGEIGIGSYLKGGRWHGENFWDYAPFTLRPYIKLFSTSWLYQTFAKTLPRLSSKLNNAGFNSPDVLVIASPNLVSSLQYCKARLLVYHCPSEFWNFEKSPQAVQESHEYLARKADLIIVTSKAVKLNLLKKIKIAPDKVKVVEHGTYISYSKKSNNHENREGIVLVGIPQTTDLTLLRNIAKRLTDIKLKIIGPFRRKEKKIFKKLPNVYFYGLLPYPETMQILKNSKIGLMCYSQEIIKTTFGSGKMKLYDYAAAGLPIISVPFADFKENESIPVKLANSPDKFIEQIYYCLNHFEELSQNSLKFVPAATWEARSYELINHIEQMLKNKA